MVDGHIATATTRGDNYHLDLDGILYLGNLSLSMSPFIYQKITKNGPYFIFVHTLCFFSQIIFSTWLDFARWITLLKFWRAKKVYNESLGL